MVAGGREDSRPHRRFARDGHGGPIVEAAIFRSGQSRGDDAPSPKERMGRDENPATRCLSVLDSGLQGIGIGRGSRKMVEGLARE